MPLLRLLTLCVLLASAAWMGWAFLDVAGAKGFWKRAGLEVERVSYPDGTSYLDAPYRYLQESPAAAPIHSQARLLERNAPGGGLDAYLLDMRHFLLIHEPKGGRYRPRELFDASWTTRILREIR